MYTCFMFCHIYFPRLEIFKFSCHLPQSFKTFAFRVLHLNSKEMRNIFVISYVGDRYYVNVDGRMRMGCGAENGLSCTFKRLVY